MPINIPYDILEEVVASLKLHPEALRQLGSTSQAFNTLTRPILFQQVHIRSVQRLIQLSSLILTRHLTIPDNIVGLNIEIQELKRADAQFPTTEVREALAIVLDHFGTIRLSVTLHLPWLLSRMLDWEYLARSCENIRKFVLSGTYSWPRDLVRTLPQMTALDSLVLDATWNSDEGEWDDLPNGVALPSGLQEICCSANSLDFLGWACSLGTRPQNLHTLRIKIDGRNSRFASICIPPFLKKYGQNLKHLYLWFEEVPSTFHVYRDLGRGISEGNLHLLQLEVFLPTIFEEEDDDEVYSDSQEEISNISDAIAFLHPGRHLSAIRIRTGYTIAVDGGDFWEVPSGGRDCGAHCMVLVE